MPSGKRPHIVIMGGGTGTSVLLSGLKHYPVSLSAIITTADDGSSSGVLRKEFNMIPPGDIRQCLIALAHNDYNYLNDRFRKGFLYGHTLGNLLITLFYQKNNNFQEAIDQLLQLVGAEGSLIPMTLRPVTLVAELANGKKLKGEHEITLSKHIKHHLKKLSLLPLSVKANPRALHALKEADLIVVAPGNLYSSIVPNLLVSEIRRAFLASRAKKIYIANLFTQPGHTDDLCAQDFLHILERYTAKNAIDYVLYNTSSVPPLLMKKYAKTVGSLVTSLDTLNKDTRYIGRPLVSTKIRVSLRADPIAAIRNPFLHDAEKLAAAVMDFV